MRNGSSVRRRMLGRIENAQQGVDVHGVRSMLDLYDTGGEVSSTPCRCRCCRPPSGAHGSLSSGFSMLSFGELGEPVLAHVEHTFGALQPEKAPDVTRARLVFDQLRSLALAPDASRELITRVAGQM